MKIEISSKILPKISPKIVKNLVKLMTIIYLKTKR